MANFRDSPHFTIHNSYYTPMSAWDNIKHLINRTFTDKAIIYECFLLNSNEQSKKNLIKLGYKVVGNKKIDFLGTKIPDKSKYDLIVSNPPFERIASYKERKSNLKYRCLAKLIELDKPFIILLNSTNIFQKWFMELVQDKDIKFIFPSKKIEYDKYDDAGKVKQDTKGSCSFNSVYVTYKVLNQNEWI